MARSISGVPTVTSCGTVTLSARSSKAELVNAQFKQPFAAYWGEGTTSSSDGQRFRAGGRGEASGQINARYGGEPGVLFSTHLSDQTPRRPGTTRKNADTNQPPEG